MKKSVSRIVKLEAEKWDVKGEVEQVFSHDGGSKAYTVLGDQGGHYLRNGRFIKLRLKKARKLLHVTFGPVHSAGG